MPRSSTIPGTGDATRRFHDMKANLGTVRVQYSESGAAQSIKEEHMRHFLSAVGAILLTTQAGHAHFLFLRITPPAEAGRAAEVFFSDLPEAGDTRFISKIAHTQLWVQREPGKFAPLKAHQGDDRLRAVLSPGGSLAVIGHCEYGVLPRKTPFLLRHFPKAVDGTADEINKLQPTDKVPLEVVAMFSPDRVVVKALHNGKPLPGAPFFAVGTGLKDVKFAANEQGEASWQPPRPGRYAIYTQLFSKVAGKRGDKPYEEIRDFATLTFTWPLAPTAADPDAVALFQEAIAARAMWRDFPGFVANITGKVGDRPFKGTVTVDSKGGVDVNVDDDVAHDGVNDQMDSIVLHRRAADGKDSKPPVLRFADADTDHPLGRLVIFEGGRMASTYRVKHKQIMVVNRHMGKETFTITVLDNTQNAEGQFLPRSYTVQYWDAATGALKRTESVQERWRRVGKWDLPESRTMTTASAAGLSVRSFTLSNHETPK